MKFILNGCDISFIAEAPEDITLKQLLKQCDKIKPDWCACGICYYEKVYESDHEPEIIIGYDSIRKHLAECGYHTAETREKYHPYGCVHRKLEDMPDEGWRSK